MTVIWVSSQIVYHTSRNALLYSKYILGNDHNPYVRSSILGVFFSRITNHCVTNSTILRQLSFLQFKYLAVVEGPPRFLPRIESESRSENEVRESVLQLLLEKDGLSQRRAEPDYLNPATEINVKLADLGNACWTVCSYLC